MKIGIMAPFMVTLGGGEKYVAVMAEELSAGHQVDLIIQEQISRNKVAATLGVRLAGVNLRVIDAGDLYFEFDPDWAREQQRAGITAEYDLFINLANDIPFLNGAPRGLAVIQFPFNKRNLPRFWRERLNSYRTVAVYSEYVRQWVRNYWGIEAQVLHPPVTVPESWGNKQKIILAVGRFFPGSHNKKHLRLIRAFRELLARGHHGWQLHLAGGVENNASDRQYLQQVAASAQGLPVVLHPNMAYQNLLRLYQAASIYWHATGWGENAQNDPERFEHFGLTTVEAMACGAVPVVINAGGQTEIVNHGFNGFLWQNGQELLDSTALLMTNKGIRARMSERARERSRAFNRSVFAGKLHWLIQKLELENR